MTHDDVVDVLAKVAAYDQRTVGQADVLAWHEALSDVDRSAALTAVTRHYRESTDRLMPAHIRRLARTIRDERRRLGAKAAPRELPSRFETDAERDDRMARGVAEVQAVLNGLVKKWSMPS